METQAPSPSPNIRRSHDGKLPNVCPCLNKSFYRAKHKKKRMLNLTKPKKVWVPKEKPPPEPKKMKQVWVSKITSPEPETKLVNDVRKKHWNQKSPGKKRSVLKPQASCSTLDQKSLEEVRYVPREVIANE